MKNRAFTLLEVLVTLVIVSMLSTAIYGIFLGAILDTRTVQDIEEVERLGQSILALMERDLKGCIPGDEDQVNFVGASSTTGTAAMNFLTTTDSHTLTDGLKSDISEVGYLVTVSSAEDGSNKLYRREEYSTDGDVTRGGTLRLLAEKVRELSFEYFDGTSWFATWSGPVPPPAVRVKLVLTRLVQMNLDTKAREEEFTFSAVISVPTGECR